MALFPLFVCLLIASTHSAPQQTWNFDPQKLAAEGQNVQNTLRDKFAAAFNSNNLRTVAPEMLKQWKQKVASNPKIQAAAEQVKTALNSDQAQELKAQVNDFVESKQGDLQAAADQVKAAFNSEDANKVKTQVQDFIASKKDDIQAAADQVKQTLNSDQANAIKTQVSDFVNDLKDKVQGHLDASQSVDKEQIKANIDSAINDAKEKIKSTDFNKVISDGKSKLQSFFSSFKF